MKHLIFSFFTILLLSSCASNSKLNNSIETSDNDLLKDESLMRYNTARLDLMDKSETDFISKATIACHQRKFLKGLTLLEGQMQSNKMNPYYWNALGICYYLQQEYTKSTFYFEMGLEAIGEKDPNRLVAEATLQNNVGLIHLLFHRYDDAFETFKKASSLLPGSMTPKFNMAQLLLEFNEVDKAQKILIELMEKNPNDIDVLYSLALIYFKKNEFNDCFKTINKIKNDYLNRPDIVGLYARILIIKKKYEEARIILEHRLYANEYDQRNKILHEDVLARIKEDKRIKAEQQAKQEKELKLLKEKVERDQQEREKQEKLEKEKVDKEKIDKEKSSATPELKENKVEPEKAK